MSRDRVGTEPPDRDGRPDEELARLASQGERDAVGELFAAYGDDLYRVCVALGGDRGGKELLERTLKRAAIEIRSGTRGLPVAPWLFTLAYEEAHAAGPPPAEARAH